MACAGWTSCAARCGGRPGRRAGAGGWTARWSRSASCWTGRWRPSGGRCSPTRTTRPGSPRRSWTRCRTTRPGRSASCRTTSGARDEARQAYEEIKDLLRREVLDSQFRGMRDALRGATQEDMARIREMISALNDMLEADARGEHTQEQFDRFMEQYGEFFPENPADLAELVDTLARRAAAQQRLLDSLSDEQRQELADLMAGAMGDAGLANELERLQQATAGGPAGPALGRPGADGRRPPARPRRRHRRAAGDRRPGRARRDARPGLPRAPRWTTSTPSWWSGRSAGRRSTTSRRCAGSSGSCSGRATSTAAAGSWS